MSLANTNDYGVVVGDGDKKLEGLSMLRDFLYEVVGYTEMVLLFINFKIYMMFHIYLNVKDLFMIKTGIGYLLVL